MIIPRKIKSHVTWKGRRQFVRGPTPPPLVSSTLVEICDRIKVPLPWKTKTEIYYMQVTVNSELGKHEHFQATCKQVRI